jgi:outer membrane scaffolding protein for murein synthesis (MipA/OmpV family)
MRFRTLFLAALSCAAVSGAARAQDWFITLGGGAMFTTPYEGADNYVIVPYPLFGIREPGPDPRFIPTDASTNFVLYEEGRLVAGATARFRYERDDDGELTGIDKVAFAMEPGVFVDFWPQPWLRTHIEIRKGIGGHTGWLTDFGFDLVGGQGRWDYAVGPRVGFGDDTYMDKYFGVSAREAAASPFIGAYDIEAGIRYVGIQTAAAYDLGGGWRTNIYGGYHRLVSDAADSPLVRIAGSADEFSVGADVVYTFPLN